jgi:hypothetical protein
MARDTAPRGDAQSALGAGIRARKTWRIAFPEKRRVARGGVPSGMMMTPTLADRCGGSTGFERRQAGIRTCFPFNPGSLNGRGTSEQPAF